MYGYASCMRLLHHKGTFHNVVIRHQQIVMITQRSMVTTWLHRGTRIGTWPLMPGSCETLFLSSLSLSCSITIMSSAAIIV